MIHTDIYFSLPANSLPCVTLANSVTIDLPYVHFQRIPTEYILYIILDGEMYLTEDTTEYTLKPGDFIFLDPSRCHFGREGSRCFYYYIHFSLSDITEVHYPLEEYLKILFQTRLHASAFTDSALSEISHVLLPKYFHLSGQFFSQLQSYAKNLLLAFHRPIEFHTQTCNCMLLSLFIMMQHTLTDLASHQSNYKYNVLSLEIIAYLKIYYPEKITSKRLEQHFYKNFDYLNRIFKKAIGSTIFQWLNNYRINEAKKLLQTSNIAHQHIAEQTGFSNEFYFSKVFKKITGITPTEYRKQFIH